eukprot:Tamp_19118.p1 GENE.Tamp_19118~~Tamp_19118.p1  ORF type:complete len:371 (+),score=83.81 Tamp_19118:61-1173(+)
MQDEGGQRQSLGGGGLQSVLARKGDEHAFSLLYLLAGVFCLYAAYGHGDGFCTNDPAPAGAGGVLGGILAGSGGSGGGAGAPAPGAGGALAAAPTRVAALDPAAMSEMKNRALSRTGRRSLLQLGAGGRVWHPDPRLAADGPAGRGGALTVMDLAERPAAARAAREDGAGMAQHSLASAMAVLGVDSLLFRGDKNQSAPDAGGLWWPWGGGAQSLADGAPQGEGSSDAAAAPPSASAEAAWAGRHGWVVLWLRVEGFAALFLPLVSIVMLSMGLQDSVALHATLYLVALFQALCLGVGCIWSFGGFVPAACTDGSVGDPFAYQAMWWVCAVWLGAIVSFSTFTCCILCCFVGAFVRKQESIRSQHADASA